MTFEGRSGENVDYNELNLPKAIGLYSFAYSAEGMKMATFGPENRYYHADSSETMIYPAG